jgi:uncharacterized glyoxalase superfamily protein PhnB
MDAQNRPIACSTSDLLQVRNVRAGHARLATAGVPVIREPAAEPWGLTEMRVEDPGGIRTALAGVPAGHPSSP